MRIEPLDDMRPELRPEMVVLKTVINDRLQVLELVSRIEVACVLDLITKKEVAIVD